MTWNLKWSLSLAFMSIVFAAQGCDKKPAETKPGSDKSSTSSSGSSSTTAATAPSSKSSETVSPTAGLSEADARDIAVEAYIYGYPLVTMEMTRRVMTNVAAPEKTRAPMGQLCRAREYPDASYRDVTAPNADTLYTIVWLDVSKEPWVLSIPDMGDRYFLFPMLSGWTDVFEVPGKRTTGDKAQKYAITGPGWKGDLPEGVKEHKSPTSLVWVLGRIYCTGTPEDYKAVHEAQDQCSVVPLSSYGKPYTPPESKIEPSIDMKTAVRTHVNAMDAASYFKLLASLMKANPPAAEDAPMVAKLARIGIVPGEEFDSSKLDASAAKDVPKRACKKSCVS